MATEKLPVVVDFDSNNKSLRNTIFSSPDGSVEYIVETPRKHCGPWVSTISKRERDSGHVTPLAILNFKNFGKDTLTLNGRDPVAVATLMPRGSLGFLGS